MDAPSRVARRIRSHPNHPMGVFEERARGPQIGERRSGRKPQSRQGDDLGVDHQSFGFGSGALGRHQPKRISRHQRGGTESIDPPPRPDQAESWQFAVSHPLRLVAQRNEVGRRSNGTDSVSASQGTGRRPRLADPYLDLGRLTVKEAGRVDPVDFDLLQGPVRKNPRPHPDQRPAPLPAQTAS